MAALATTSRSGPAVASRRPGISGSPRTAQLGLGALTGTSAFLWTHQFLASFGVSLPVTAAMTLCVGVGISAGLLLCSRAGSARTGAWSVPAAWLTLAAWSVAFPSLLGVGRWFITLASVSALTSEATAFCLLLLVAGCLLIVPTLACMRLATSLDFSPRRATPPGLSPSFILGTGIGLAAGSALVGPLAGLTVTMALVTAAAAVGFWRSLIRALSDPGRGTESPSVAAGPPSTCPWACGLSLLIGLQIPLASRFAMRLMPGSAFEHYAAWSGVLCGVALGVAATALAKRRQKADASADGVLSGGVIAAIWAALLIAVWPLLVDVVLTVNSSVSFVPGVMLIRMALAGAALAPLGAALGRIWSASNQEQWSLPAGIVAATLGVVLTKSAAFAPATMMSVLAIAAAMMVGCRYWWLKLPALGRRQQLGGLLAALSVAVLPAIRGNYRPDLAAHLLFSTSTFSARQSGISRNLLPHLDDGRLVRLEDGRDATWTVWKHRGSQLVLRENGLPRGILSTDPQACPQFAGEIMPAVLPMVLHERPQSVLLLGLGSTASLSSILSCPVQSVTCVERDADLIRLADELFAPSAGANPLEDERVRLLNIDPTLAILAGKERYDVLIVGEGQPSVLASASVFTQEFYTAARRCLRADGLFCQRLQYADFGRGPIEDVLATLQQIFPQVALFDAAPGEMLLVATSKEQPLVDEATVERCSSAHIRRLMAQIGWDWSVLMNVGAISPEAVAELTARRGTPNTVANGRFSCGLPQEVMRWSPPQMQKWQERQTLLNEHASRMLTWLGDTELTTDVEQRLADVIEQQRLIVDHPDHFWAYRKTLKERLIERPRAAIQQVRHEGLKRTLHPEDQRRKDYLQALGAAATSRVPAMQDVRELANFAAPYDPLVSYFLHQEAARLYEKSDDECAAARLHHWRYSVYFGPPSDRSVRNVIAALELVNEHPELIADPVDRWDEMNSLLEVLKQRSTLRLRIDKTASSFELVDAERSIEVARRTMTAMDALCEPAGVSRGDWQQRRTVLERMLIRPMWTYHSRQAARLAKIQSQTRVLSAESDDDTDTR